MSPAEFHKSNTAQVRIGRESANRWRPEQPPAFGSFYAAAFGSTGPPVGTYDVTYNVDNVPKAARPGEPEENPQRVARKMRLKYPTGSAAPEFTMHSRHNSYGHSRTHSNWIRTAIARAEEMPGPGAYEAVGSVDPRHSRNTRALPGGAGVLSRGGRF